MKFSIEKLDPDRHDRAGFGSGVPELDRFFKELASQHQRKYFSTTYVLVDQSAPPIVLGYYSISFGEISLSGLSAAERKKLPRHPIPAARMGRLAVSENERGKGYGALLLQHAVKQCLAARTQIACYALVVDAKNETAARFYEKYGFRAAAPAYDQRSQLYLPLGMQR